MSVKRSLLSDLNIKIFGDGADLDSIIEAYSEHQVDGFTTNPTLMAKAGITNYMTFATEVLRVVKDLPVSFEVFSDDFEGMYRQAMKLKELGDNVYVKIPVTNTLKEPAYDLIHKLSAEGLQLNITAILTINQARNVVDALDPESSGFVSVFAGRIADTGVDPLPVMQECLEICKTKPKAELLWASPREFFNIVQAERMGCHIITVLPSLLTKAKFLGMDLEELSLETVKMFYHDATSSGFKILED